LPCLTRALVTSLVVAGCGDGVAKINDDRDGDSAAAEDEPTPGGDGDVDADTVTVAGGDGTGEPEVDINPIGFPIVYDFDDGMDGFASEYDGWAHNPLDGTVELDCELTGPGVFNFLELDLTTSSWRGVDWTGATAVEYRVKTLESNGGLLQPYLQTDAETWNWFSQMVEHPPTDEWTTIELDVTLAPEEMEAGHALELSGALKLGIQVFGPQEGYLDAAALEPDASEPPYPEPVRVRIAIDSVIVRGPEPVDAGR
jgi:hypothetical protein